MSGLSWIFGSFYLLLPSKFTTPPFISTSGGLPFSCFAVSRYPSCVFHRLASPSIGWIDDWRCNPLKVHSLLLEDFWLSQLPPFLNIPQQLWRSPDRNGIYFLSLLGKEPVLSFSYTQIFSGVACQKTPPGSHQPFSFLNTWSRCPSRPCIIKHSLNGALIPSIRHLMGATERLISLYC